MQNACRPSSAVQRLTHSPHALSRPNARSTSRWELGRLSSVRRFTSNAVRAIGESVDCSTDHGSPSRCAKLRPSVHGTYSWGIHSWATPRWRLRLSSTVGASSLRSVGVSITPGLSTSAGPGTVAWPNRAPFRRVPPAHPGVPVERLARLVMRHRLIVSLFWLVTFVLGGVAAGQLSDRLTLDFSLPGQPGDDAENVLI